MNTYGFLCLILMCGVASLSAAREWTSTDGRKVDAAFVSTAGDAVTLKRTSDGQVLNVPLNRLSDEDQTWVKEQPAAAAAATSGKPSLNGAAKPLEGPFASLITGEWALSEFEGQKFAFYGGKNLDTTDKIPLVLTLHGRSKNEENGKQVGGWMKTFAKPGNYAKRPCFIVAPLSAQPESGEGYGWNGKEMDTVIKL